MTLDHHNESVASQYHDDDDYTLSCCQKIRNKLCCNRIYATKNNIYETSIESSRSKTLESVQAAVDGKISLSKAKLHRYLTTPNWGPKKKFAPYNIWNFPLALFNDYGIGTKLFFEFLVKLAFISLCITIIHIPIYYMLYTVNALNESSSFEQFSLGNLGGFNSTSISSTFKVVDIEWIGISLSYREINEYFAYSDFFCILLLLSFVIWFESTLRLKEKEYDDMTTTVGDFSVEVNNLPLNLSSRRALADFFEERWGEIMDVSLCYNDGHIVKMYLGHSKIINKFTKSKVLYSKATKATTRAKETNKLQRLQTKLDKSTMNMLNVAHQFNDGERYCVKAYVTFENEPERNICLREYYQQKNNFKYFCQKNPRFVYT